MLKSILLTSLLALPVLGIAQAAPVGTPERSAEIRAELSVNRAQYDDAVRADNWERAHIERGQIERNLVQLEDNEAAMGNHYLLRTPATYDYSVTRSTYYPVNSQPYPAVYPRHLRLTPGQ